MKHLALILPLALVAACSAPEDPAPEATTEASEAPAATAPAPADGAAAPAEPASPSPAGEVLALEGFADLRIGQPLPAGGAFAVRGAQASDTCLIATSPDHPGMYAIVEGDRVRRISAGERSDVKLAEGIGVGASEAEVKRWFPSFRETPHKYVAAPGKYLTAPNARSGDPALRFEIGADRKVTAIHVGTMPVLGYVEVCS